MHRDSATFNKIGENDNEKSLLRRQLAKFQGKERVLGTTKVDAVIMSLIS